MTKRHFKPEIAPDALRKRAKFSEAPDPIHKLCPPSPPHQILLIAISCLLAGILESNLFRDGIYVKWSNNIHVIVMSSASLQCHYSIIITSIKATKKLQE